MDGLGVRRKAATEDQRSPLPIKVRKRKAESPESSNLKRKAPKQRRAKPIQKDKIHDSANNSGSKDREFAKHARKAHVEHQRVDNQKSYHAVDVEEGDRSTSTPASKGGPKLQSSTMPLAIRSQGLSFKIGAHVSGAKGVHNAVTNAVHIGANSFAMFLKSQRKEEHRELFHANVSQSFHAVVPRITVEVTTIDAPTRCIVSAPLVQAISLHQKCERHDYKSDQFVLPHGSYLVNLAQAEPEKAQQAFESFLDDLRRCEALGIKLYNFHPGSTGGAPRKSAIERIADALNRAHAATDTVIPILEAMAGSGNVIGSTFEDLRDIIGLVRDQSRVGVCIDTAHVFAAGYDLRSPSAFQATFEKFDKIVGLKFLKAFHLNDSKAPLGSNRDLHQNIGLGFLGLRAFHNIMNDDRFQNLPLVLETPIDNKDSEGKVVEDKAIWAREIKLLESLRGMKADSQQFKAIELELAARGAVERKKFEEAFDKKQAKIKKKENGQGKLSFKV